jgi:hypothetical protein
MVGEGSEAELRIGPILACADTNAATDNILEGLYRKGVTVIRMGKPTSVSIFKSTIP